MKLNRTNLVISLLCAQRYIHMFRFVVCWVLFTIKLHLIALHALKQYYTRYDNRIKVTQSVLQLIVSCMVRLRARCGFHRFRIILRHRERALAHNNNNSCNYNNRIVCQTVEQG